MSCQHTAQFASAIRPVRLDGAPVSVGDLVTSMPVVLDESRLDEWMDPANADSASLRAMLLPAPDDWLIDEPASPLVNSVKNDGPELLG